MEHIPHIILTLPCIHDTTTASVPDHHHKVQPIIPGSCMEGIWHAVQAKQSERSHTKVGCGRRDYCVTHIYTTQEYRNNTFITSHMLQMPSQRPHRSSVRGPPFIHTHCSPIAVEKTDGSYRLILDLSSPRGEAVNEGIDLEKFSMTYSYFDNAVDIVRKLGAGSHMAKIDIKHAFRICPVKNAQDCLSVRTAHHTFSTCWQTYRCGS